MDIKEWGATIVKIWRNERLRLRDKLSVVSIFLGAIVGALVTVTLFEIHGYAAHLYGLGIFAIAAVVGLLLASSGDQARR